MLIVIKAVNDTANVEDIVHGMNRLVSENRGGDPFAGYDKGNRSCLFISERDRFGFGSFEGAKT